MSSTAASTIIGGPALVTFNGATVYVEKDIKVKLVKETKKRTVAAFGTIGEVFMDVKAEISFAPAQWKNLAILQPYLTALPGTRIFGDADVPLVIQSITEGKKWTWSRCAITKTFDMDFGAKKNLIGEMTITALKANAADWSGATSIVALADNAFADTSFDRTTLFDLPYQVSWLTNPAAEPPEVQLFDTADGIQVKRSLTLKPVDTDQAGVIDMWLQDQTIEATFKPIGLSHADLLALLNVQGGSLARGRQMILDAHDLVIAGANVGDPTATLFAAAVKDSSLLYAPGAHLGDGLTFVVNRQFTSGMPTAIAAFGVVPTPSP